MFDVAIAVYVSSINLADYSRPLRNSDEPHAWWAAFHMIVVLLHAVSASLVIYFKIGNSRARAVIFFSESFNVQDHAHTQRPYSHHN